MESFNFVFSRIAEAPSKEHDTAWSFVPGSMLAAFLAGLLCIPAALSSPRTIHYLPQSLQEIRALIADGRPSRAEESARELLASLEADRRGESMEAAEAMELLAEAMRKNGKASMQETMDYARRAVERKAKLAGEESAGHASGLYQLGILQYVNRRYAESRDLLERALAIREEILGATHPDVALNLIMLGSLHSEAFQDFDASYALLERAREIQDEVLEPEHPDVAWRLDIEACNKYNQYRFEEAERLFEQCLRIRENVLRPGHPLTTKTLHNLALVLMIFGDYLQARNYLERELEVIEREFGGDHLLMRSPLSGLASLMDRMGDAGEACRLYDRALEIQEGILGPDHPDLARDLVSLAELKRDAGDHEAAEDLYERVFWICEKHAEALSDSLRAEVMTSYGALLQRIGRLEEAGESYERAQGMIEDSGDSEGVLAVRLLHNKATLEYVLGRREEGRALLEHVVSSFEEQPGSDTALFLWTLVNLALTDLDFGRWKEAMDRALRVERTARERFRRSFRGLEGRLALKYASSGKKGLHLAVSIAAHFAARGAPRLEEAFEAVIRWRALVLDEMVARKRAVKDSGDRRIAALQSEWYRACKVLADLTVGGGAEHPDGFDPEGYEKAVARKEKAERALGEASRKFRKEVVRAEIGLEKVREALPDGCGLVAYLRYFDCSTADEDSPPSTAEALRKPEGYLEEMGARPAYAACILFGKDAELRMVRLGWAEEIDRRIGGWRVELQKGLVSAGLGPETEESCRQAGAALRNAIWYPVARHLEGARTVFIVPDGALHLVNFAALPGEGESYLVETGPAFHYLSAEREIVEWKEGSETGHGLLVIGDPDYGEKQRPLAAEPSRYAASAGSIADRYRSLSFTEVPQTGREAVSVHAIWTRLQHRDAAGLEAGEPVKVLREEAATEAAFKNQAPGRRVLHLATHGFFLIPGSAVFPGRTARGLATGKVTPPEALVVVSKPDENPLLRSGLALANANRRSGSGAEDEDGILTAEEIAALDLSGVEWAVLSACDTGLGSVEAGEGVFGLRRAFQLAGVRTVVMSLWSVEDRAARLWMEKFYTARLGGKLNAPDAVRAANIALLEQRRSRGSSTHPFFWAAFVAAGDWK